MEKFDYKKYLAEGKLYQSYNDDDRYEVDGSSVGDGKYEDEESELQKFELEPEDLDNPDEDLVIIGSGYLDIKNNFGERPSQTNGEYAEIGQKVVDQLHKGDKEAAIDYIYSQINEGESKSDYGLPIEVSFEESKSGVPGDKFLYFRFLDSLRDSGQTNMFGAGQYLETYFDLDKREAREILTAWMKSFDSIDENLSDEEIEHHVKMAKLGGGDEKSLRKIAKVGKDNDDWVEKKSKFKKTGEKMGFDMRGINELTGYDDPKYPKAKHHAADRALEHFAVALGNSGVSANTIEEMFHKMGSRIAHKYGDNE